MEKILLGHGSGGQLSHDLIKDLFVKHFNNQTLDQQTDAAILEINTKSISFTTDSFVVDPIFFPGGDIGKLAVCGTVNDLAVSGAKPKYMSASYIIEEGLPYKDLERIVISMANEAKIAGINIVTGDTKVVNRGKCDKVFINTTGVGEIEDKFKEIGSGKNIEIGDKIIINGTIGDHGMSILKARELNRFKANIQSDCACLNSLISKALEISDNIHFMRDATRGGLATVLSELVESNKFGIELFESEIPIREEVRGMCEIIGFDPLYVANEGIVLMVLGKDDADQVLETIRKDELGKNAAIIGEITDKHPRKGWVQTEIGGKRIIDMLAGEQLPRIC
ncbi:MAG: hydrogenase expression/formation protein HypE [Bacteroidetes bacterium]|jgi:hydrogenase expression/formation protein HypE|nr:hydrogenase expression/formation protein HypE [Bacteroidota bacterium]MBT5528197.1 hydrogenase expression/formation protein HypE [Cytophagia bacterium]MBT3422958.1 hydrogenase expression/formation protein HypE [Bacteroidota bacterium]MBT3801693.1 hydrogenase expression/formation protein HypE [Bacteroidota bacterium]MBT4337549.1 hydrogenase expression/formation protein HypE [Bacteroidota bacterium]